MKILWITNILMPPVASELGVAVPAVGGWMFSSLKRLLQHLDLEVAVAAPYGGKEFNSLLINGVRYYALPTSGRSLAKYNADFEQYFKKVKEDFCPDVVHIHGTEYPHSLAYVRACGADGVVVSIQGMLSVISRYYLAGISETDIRQFTTFRDVIRRDSVLNAQKNFEKRGHFEVELLKSINNIIGRTEWDKAHCHAINASAHYHYCGETLRDAFYSHKWSYLDCEVHSIFVSQASYPLKGVHMLFEALPLILREYPDTQLYIAGTDPTTAPWWRIGGYGKYLKSRIDTLEISGHIHFTGMLDEEAMCRRYLKSNVFVCCSSIENSPNSLGEAQMLGMPYVASFVGGVPEIVNMKGDVLYRFEEYEMMASKICNIFRLADKFAPYDFDRSRYDGVKNTYDLIEVYRSIK